MLLVCFGTRPEWLKIKPLIKKLDNYKLLFTGQHTDLLNDVDVDYKISIPEDGFNRLDTIISNCMIQFPKDDEIESVMVQGDTASAFACALAAFNRHLKIYYLEAGLRTDNLQHPYPEEGYRQMISRISDVNFAPTELSKMNLMKENVLGDLYVVGNTILDNLTDINTTYTNKVLVTLHRRENHHIMSDWFKELDKLAYNYPNIEFILPIHPNPNVQKHKHILKNIKIIDPLDYDDMINLMKDVKLIITDSGGLQEEGTFLNKKVIVCRLKTERPEGIDTGHLYLCDAPQSLSKKFKSLINNHEINKKCPYGDGNSSEKIKNILERLTIKKMSEI